MALTNRSKKDELASSLSSHSSILRIDVRRMQNDAQQHQDATTSIQCAVPESFRDTPTLTTVPSMVALFSTELSKREARSSRGQTPPRPPYANWRRGYPAAHKRSHAASKLQNYMN